MSDYKITSHPKEPFCCQVFFPSGLDEYKIYITVTERQKLMAGFDKNVRKLPNEIVDDVY
jgi:hypothetical protein